MNTDRFTLFMNALNYFVKEKGFHYKSTSRRNAKDVNLNGFHFIVIYAGSGIKWYIKGKSKTKFLPANTESDFYQAIKYAYDMGLQLVKARTSNKNPVEIPSTYNQVLRNFYDDPDYNIPDECDLFDKDEEESEE